MGDPRDRWEDLRAKGVMFNWIAYFWCRKMHARAMWPIHGRYICPRCLREYPISWADGLSMKAAAGASLERVETQAAPGSTLVH